MASRHDVGYGSNGSSHLMSSSSLFVCFLILAVTAHLGSGNYIVKSDVLVGYPCQDGWGCQDLANGVCSTTEGEGTCQCDVGYYDKGDKLCTKHVMVGDPCEDGKGCEDLAHSVCSATTGVGSCICDLGYHSVLDKLCGKDVMVGDICKDGMGCQDLEHGDCNVTMGYGTCQCDVGYYDEGDKLCTAVYGKKCNTSDDCSQLQYAVCDGDTCTCAEGYLKKANLCAPDLNSTCTGLIECYDEMAICDSSSNVCKCQKGCTDSEGVCKAYLGSYCYATDNSCLDQFANCTDHVCRCWPGYKEKDNICKADLNSNCVGPIGCYDEMAMCDSSSNVCKCQKGYTDSEGVCKAEVPGSNCQEGYTATEGGCRAGYNQACTPKDGCVTLHAVCTNSMTTDGTWRCICPSGESYVEAHDRCSGSITSLTLGAAILSLTLRFIL